MNFIILEVNDIEVIFSHFLETAEIFVADLVPFVKGCAFILPGANFGHVVG
jgi:hypothetical protein